MGFIIGRFSHGAEYADIRFYSPRGVETSFHNIWRSFVTTTNAIIIAAALMSAAIASAGYMISPERAIEKCERWSTDYARDFQEAQRLQFNLCYGS